MSVICVKAIIYLLLYNLDTCTFNEVTGSLELIIVTSKSLAEMCKYLKERVLSTKFFLNSCGAAQLRN